MVEVNRERPERYKATNEAGSPAARFIVAGFKERRLSPETIEMGRDHRNEEKIEESGDGSEYHGRGSGPEPGLLDGPISQGKDNDVNQPGEQGPKQSGRVARVNLALGKQE